MISNNHKFYKSKLSNNNMKKREGVYCVDVYSLYKLVNRFFFIDLTE